MASSFRAYIDESGDDGFFFKPDGTGSSDWMVLSAAVIRTKNDIELVRALSDVRTTLGKAHNFPLHFRDLTHDKRKAYIARLAATPTKMVSVVAFKKNPVSINPFLGQKHLFYRYLTRLLVERVSWICRDERIAGEGDGKTELIFSDRSSMSYQDVRDYIDHLKTKCAQPGHGINIDWGSIDSCNVTSVSHSKLAGLQIADAVASGMFYAVNLNKYRQIESSYVEDLLPRYYRYRTGKLSGYGIKWWPWDFAKIQTANPYLKKLAAWK
jgi:Protein of unknown function (DUF3800)